MHSSFLNSSSPPLSHLSWDLIVEKVKTKIKSTKKRTA